MTLDQVRQQLNQQYSVLAEINLSGWRPEQWLSRWADFDRAVARVYQQEYQPRQRICFVFDPRDYDPQTWRLFFRSFIDRLFRADISNFFAVILTTAEAPDIVSMFEQYSPDPVPPTVTEYEPEQPPPRARTPDTFCILPWNHLMISADQPVRTCCWGQKELGRADRHSLHSVWHSSDLQEIRDTLQANSYHPNCEQCYATEALGLQSLRQKSNRNFSRDIAQARQSTPGQPPPFDLRYFDLRFSNLCNMRCRTCGHHSSSRWHADTQALDPDYDQPVLIRAGAEPDSVWSQILPHVSTVERVYFAGGEPLIMQEHWALLTELLAQGRTDVNIRYNTNFSVMQFRSQTVFDIWPEFESVRVSASLDGEGARAEYIRKDTDWAQTVLNRREMMARCPDVAFDIHPTVSILNVWSIMDFHRSWVEQGLIRPQDFYINLLQDPAWLRVDIATPEFRQQVQQKIQAHQAWLAEFPGTEYVRRDYDSIVRAMKDLRPRYLEEFWRRTRELDRIRNEDVLVALPELKELL